MDFFRILFPLAAFLMGSIPFGSIIGRKVADIDIKAFGSGNIGATNVAREIGLKWGIFTLLLDLLKGFIPAYIVNYHIPAGDIWLIIVCISSLLGHQFSIFLRFRGGKGVATAAGIFLALSPVSLLIAIVIFIIGIYLFDTVSTGSMAAACSMPLILYLSGKSLSLVIASIFMAMLICLAHRENIKNILKGEERKWRSRVS